MSKNIGDEDLTQINPHMPQYIIKAPWYLNQTEPSLNHQKAQIEQSKIPISAHTMKGILQEKRYFKFRKGACENCGADTHKAKDCCERPRKKGAKFTGRDFKPDEYIYEVPLDYEGKRDRWNGYDPNTYTKKVHEWERLEEVKRKKKEEMLQTLPPDERKKKEKHDEDIEKSVSSSSSEQENPEEEALEAENAPGNFKEPTVKREMTVKDLKINNPYSKSNKINDDFAKYLLNLDPDSAYYDGKSRSMRGNPTPNTDDSTFKGENHIRTTGDAMTFLEIENFVNDANDKNPNQTLNNISMPTQAELFYKYYKDKKDKVRSENLQKAISKYGGEEHLQAPDEVKNITDSDVYVEYNPNGKVKVQSQKKKIASSAYPEDVFINGHTAVWGSFYNDDFGWGYKCCYSFQKSSYCHGQEGKKENLEKIEKYNKRKKEEEEKEKERRRLEIEKNEELMGLAKDNLFSGFVEKSTKIDKRNFIPPSPIATKTGLATDTETVKLLGKKRENPGNPNFDSEISSSKDKKEELDQDKVRAAMLKEKERRLKDADLLKNERSKNKKGNFSKEDDTITAEDMEAFRLMKQHFDDPMKGMR